MKWLQYLFLLVLLCRKCGHNIVDGHDVCEKISTLALKIYQNVSVLRPKVTMVQTFRNPEGLFNILRTFKLFLVCQPVS